MFGTVTTVALTGCTGRIPGASPEQINAERTIKPDEIHWEYPPLDNADGIGYARVELSRVRDPKRSSTVYQFDLNSTVGGPAASEPYKGYQADWFEFRIGPPAEYASQHNLETWVQPPPWPEVRLRYDRKDGWKQTIVEVKDLNDDGTISFPLQFAPIGSPSPNRFHCSFEVQASKGGLLEKSVRATGHGILEPTSNTG